MGAGAFCEMSTDPHTVLSGWFGPIETYGITGGQVVQGHGLTGHFPWAAARQGRHHGAEPNVLGVHGHDCQSNPGIRWCGYRAPPSQSVRLPTD